MSACLLTMSLLFVVLMGVLCPSYARKHTFHVGGKDGWIVKSSESYSQWAERYHFVINDELVFKYKKGHDSVLVVNENDYYKCNKDNPIKALKDGKSRFKLDRSGPFFFISGHNQNCEEGQKMVILVPSGKHHHKAHDTSSPKTRSPSPSISMPPANPPSHSSPSPEAETHIEPHYHHPQAETPAYAQSAALPDIEPADSDISPSSPVNQPSSYRNKSPHPVPSDHVALSPDDKSSVFSSTHHAPAPAPASSASAGPGDSFVLIVGLLQALVATIALL